jgi:DNA (cytosine-5)-methyltransferase 1
VTVGVADWLIGRVMTPGDVVVPSTPWTKKGRWPDAAFGFGGKAWSMGASQWPVLKPYRHLTDLVKVDAATPLSHRATTGFLSRVDRSKLKFDEAFVQDLRDHRQVMDAPAVVPKSKPSRKR